MTFSSGRKYEKFHTFQLRVWRPSVCLYVCSCCCVFSRVPFASLSFAPRPFSLGSWKYKDARNKQQGWPTRTERFVRELEGEKKKARRVQEGVGTQEQQTKHTLSGFCLLVGYFYAKSIFTPRGGSAANKRGRTKKGHRGRGLGASQKWICSTLNKERKPKNSVRHVLVRR